MTQGMLYCCSCWGLATLRDERIPLETHSGIARRLWRSLVRIQADFSWRHAGDGPEACQADEGRDCGLGCRFAVGFSMAMSCEGV